MATDAVSLDGLSPFYLKAAPHLSDAEVAALKMLTIEEQEMLSSMDRDGQTICVLERDGHLYATPTAGPSLRVCEALELLTRLMIESAKTADAARNRFAWQYAKVNWDRAASEGETTFQFNFDSSQPTSHDAAPASAESLRNAVNDLAGQVHDALLDQLFNGTRTSPR